NVHLGLRGLQRRLGALQAGLGLLERRARDEALGEHVFLPRMVVALLDYPCAGRVALGERSLQAALLVRGVELRDQLPRAPRVAPADRAPDQPAVDAEGVVDLALRLDRSRERERLARAARLDRDHAHRPDLLGRRLLGALASGRQRADR